MYDSIPTLLTPDELLDHALSRAAKIEKTHRDPFKGAKRTFEARIEKIVLLLDTRLENWIKAFPALDRVSPYERDLVDIVVGVSKLKRSLARLEGTRKVLKQLGKQGRQGIRTASNRAGAHDAYRRIVGRIASVVEMLKEPIASLAQARSLLQAVPNVTPEDPTIVLAGYPNVGKSSLLARLTRARPEIAPYPYTTKGVNVGHFGWSEPRRMRSRRYQVVDTPGLLDKPPQKRNAIEQQAALALRHLADLVLFVLDPTETCGYPLDLQKRLLESIQKEFSTVPLVVVETKCDLATSSPVPGAVSGRTGQGIEELKRRLVETIPADPYEKTLGEVLSL